MAAASSSKPPMRVQSQGETWLSRGPICHKFFNYCPRVRIGRLGCGCVSRLQRSRKAGAGLLVRGCFCEKSRGQWHEEYYEVTQEDKDFVQVMREAQPYIAVHRERVFIVVISAEIVASPYLDPILKKQKTCVSVVLW
ncbi:hypothetical protein RIF29_36955 [Crotalaria pallida]|uniref:Uncharacterized protein n=1 Tax=Crotalaria pallida TaxID=3830 RepID=A0AAN9EE44_CROPI